MLRVFKRFQRLSILFALCLASTGAALAGRNELSELDAREVFFKPGTQASIPTDKLRGNGLIDFCPSLDDPRKDPPDVAGRFIKNKFAVLGVVVNGQAVAYPLRILNWHEIVNDTIGGVPVLVAYCPLCQSGLVYERRVDGEVTNFGVCGLLYRSNMLIYDLKTRSLWTQLRGDAVVGDSLGKKLKLLPSVVTTWKEWRRAHPDTLALSVNTGYARDYRRNPMRLDEMAKHRRHRHHRRHGWDEAAQPGVPTVPLDTMVIGVHDEDHYTAVPLKALKKKKTMLVPLGPDTVSLRYMDGPRAFAADGTEIPGIVTYWKMWKAFYPATRLVVDER